MEKHNINIKLKYAIRPLEGGRATFIGAKHGCPKFVDILLDMPIPDLNDIIWPCGIQYTGTLIFLKTEMGVAHHIG